MELREVLHFAMFTIAIAHPLGQLHILVVRIVTHERGENFNAYNIS